MTRTLKFSVDEEIKQLDCQLRTLTVREADFQRLVDDLQRMKDETTRERIELERRRARLEAQKEPINWLPPELLIQIFQAFIWLDFHDSQYRSPIILSHVCTKWQAIVLDTPPLWSRMVLRGFKYPDIAQTFLSRSGQAPININYSSLPSSMPTDECHQVVDFLAKSSQHFLRCAELCFQSKAALPIVYLLPFFNDFSNTFPHLRCLALSIATPNPTFIEAPSLMERENTNLRRKKLSAPPSRSSSPLLHLTMEQVPLGTLPIGFITNLRRLELFYSPRKQHASRHDYYLKLSTLCHFLSSTPLLEELALNNTVPFFDAIPPPPEAFPVNSPDPAALIHMEPIRLEKLKSIEWTYPYTGDVPRLLCMLDAPALEKLDLWVEVVRKKRAAEVHLVRGYLPTSSSHKYIRNIHSFPSLRDLSVQCNGDETTACVLRKFSLPSLEKVAFTNVDSAARESTGDEEPPLPVFPRLESVFRDPRLPLLTHLTLSHFKISLETGRAEAVLGYMPALTSLSLDSCIGVGRFMEGLHEKLIEVDDALPGNTHPKRGVKICPRLEAISLWGCQDVDFNCLKAIVLSRNGDPADNAPQECASDTAGVPNGAAGETVTRQDTQKGGPHEGDKKEQSGHSKNEVGSQVGRKIKPLRKPRHPGPAGEVGLGSSSLDQPMNILSTFIALREILEPASIIYLRVANCRLVDYQQAQSLRDLGVRDVIWAGLD